MLRVCASLGTCIRVTHHRCNRPQKLESLSRQVQCERTPSASTFRSVPNTRHNQPSRSVRKRRLRHVIQNAGGPAGGITKSKGGKGKEVSACASGHTEIPPCLTHPLQQRFCFVGSGGHTRQEVAGWCCRRIPGFGPGCTNTECICSGKLLLSFTPTTASVHAVTYIYQRKHCCGAIFALWQSLH